MVDDCRDCQEVFASCKHCSSEGCEECMGEEFLLINGECVSKMTLGTVVAIALILMMVVVVVGKNVLM